MDVNVIGREPTPFDQAVVRAARAAVSEVDEHELPLLEDVLDPPRRLFPRWKSEAVGFGVDDAVHWVSPYAVAAALWYSRIWYDETKSVVESRTRKFVRALLRQEAPPEVEPPAPVAHTGLTGEQLSGHVRAVHQYAVALGLDEARAEVLAKAMVGALLDPPGDTPGG